MQITNLARGKTQNRINIDIDEEYGFSVEESTLVKFNLFKDKHLTGDEIEGIVNYDLGRFLKKKALDFISRRPRSKKEARDQILNKLDSRIKNQKLSSIDRGIVSENLLKELEEEGYIDDKEFSRWIIGSRKRQMKKSPFEIEMELRKFGVSENTYKEILYEEISEDNELKTIQKLVDKKMRLIDELDSKSKQKIIASLQRKGFRYDKIKKALDG